MDYTNLGAHIVPEVMMKEGTLVSQEKFLLYLLGPKNAICCFVATGFDSSGMLVFGGC